MALVEPCAAAAASRPRGAQRSGLGGPEPRRGRRAGGGGTERAAVRGGGRAASPGPAERSPAPRGVPEPPHAGWKRLRTAAARCGRAPSLQEGDPAMTAGLPGGLTWVSSAKLSPSPERA